MTNTVNPPVERLAEDLRKSVDDLARAERHGMARQSSMKRRVVDQKIERLVRAVAQDEGEPCEAFLYHGPGHQSKTRCELIGPHDVHRAIYGSMRQEATWRDGEYTDGLREKGIEFDPESYPENMGMTGFFDEPPQDDDE